MSFRDPWLLVSLVLVPALVAVYVREQRRRGAKGSVLARQGLVVTSTGGAGGAGVTRARPWSRHVPFALFTVAFALLLVALARPEAEITTPKRVGTVVLAFDVSNSMRADDLEPTRLDAAKDAARAFVEAQPSTIRIGVVSFGDGAAILQRPTDIKADALAAIDRLTPGGGTSLGQGLYSSLSAIAGKAVEVDPEALASDSASVDIGYYGSASIVLLSDGENTGRPDPSTVADLASIAGVKVHTIGVGTEQGTEVTIDGFRVATKLDRSVLEQIATDTDGDYHEATDAESLKEIYGAIEPALTTESERTEITALLAMAATVLLLAGALVSVLRTGRVV